MTTPFEPNDGGTAFPIVITSDRGSTILGAGLTKRQWYARFAMLGATIGKDVPQDAMDDVAIFAFTMADAMIQAEEE